VEFDDAGGTRERVQAIDILCQYGQGLIGTKAGLSQRDCTMTGIGRSGRDQNRKLQGKTSEPVVLRHGREAGAAGSDEVRPTASTACWAALV
jgi:hypothetical protein